MHIYLTCCRPVLLGLCLLALQACAGARDGRPPALLIARSEAPLAQVNGVTINEAHLPNATQQRLAQLDDGYAQQRLVALWTGIEDAVAERLLGEEAARRKMSLAALLQQEVSDKVGPTSEAEVRSLYEANRNIIAVPYAQAAPQLREQARDDRIKALRRALVDRLRQGANVSLSLPRIALHRLAVEAKGPRLGPVKAPIELVIFSDFACPYSAQARRTIRRLREMYPQHLQVVHRHFPLEQHPQARPAAIASICADEQKVFWPYYELLFENSGQLGQDSLQTLATRAGLDLPRFRACLTSAAPTAVLEADLAAARTLGVHGTPSMFLNGMPLLGVLPLAILQSLINDEVISMGDLDDER